MKVATDASNGLSLFVPFTKVEEDADGTVIVEGIATAEVLDSQGDVVMYDASVKAFEEWGEYFHKITDGASVGNIREMHEPVAAGKAIAWWPIPEKKQIGIRTKAVDPGSCKKILERVLTAFSIAAPGSTVERNPIDWEGKKASAITGYRLGEVSYVDRGACPEAVFTMVKRDLPSPDPVPAADAPPPAAEPAPVAKGYAEALAAAGTAEDALRVFIAEMAALPGEAATWDLRMMAEALGSICAAKHGITIDAAMVPAADKAAATKVDDPPPAPAPADAGAQKADTAPQTDLVKLLEGHRDELLKAVVDKVDAAKSELTKRLEGIDERLKVVEETPAEQGSPARPVKKTLGSDGGGNGAGELTIDQLEAGVVELERRGALDETTRVSLRKALAVAALSRQG